MSKTYSENILAKPPFRREQPSDQAIADAFWRKSHCQTHTAEDCAFVEEIIHAAFCIDAGLPLEPTLVEREDPDA